jgi:DNA-binding CsgD family transcriptional regulator
VRLTAAEKHEIIRLVEGSDLSARRTLRELGVSRRTIDNHRANLCAKLGLSGPHALTKFALDHKDSWT